MTPETYQVVSQREKLTILLSHILNYSLIWYSKVNKSMGTGCFYGFIA